MTQENQIKYLTCASVSKLAPQFSGEAYLDGKISTITSEDYKGKWIILFFYPLDFTFVCPTEIKGYNSHLKDFDKRKAQIIGCSVDSVHSHQAWSKGDLGKLGFPLLSDITKKISASFGVLLEDQGIALRGTFIIDPKGILRYSVVHDLNVGRSIDETLRVLDALQTGGLCAMDWHKGEKTLVKG